MEGIFPSQGRVFLNDPFTRHILFNMVDLHEQVDITVVQTPPVLHHIKEFHQHTVHCSIDAQSTTSCHSHAIKFKLRRGVLFSADFPLPRAVDFPRAPSSTILVPSSWQPGTDNSAFHPRPRVAWIKIPSAPHGRSAPSRRTAHCTSSSSSSDITMMIA